MALLPPPYFWAIFEWEMFPALVLGGRLVVGIAWASGNLHRPDRNAPLALWDPVLTLPGLRFVSLQYGDRAAEIAAVRERTGMPAGGLRTIFAGLSVVGLIYGLLMAVGIAL